MTSDAEQVSLPFDICGYSPPSPALLPKMGGGRKVEAMYRFARKLFLITSAAAAAGLAGCSEGPELGDVTGKVLQNGQPVPFAYVMFQPIDPPGTYASAYTNAAGEYELQFSPSANGAMIGRHEVTVRTPSKDEIEVEDKTTGKMVVPPLPAGYQERLQVQFEREVKSGDNLHDFEIANAPLRKADSGNGRIQ